jgi:hypothetical protein
LSCLPALLSLSYKFIFLHTRTLHWTIHNFINLQLCGVISKRRPAFAFGCNVQSFYISIETWRYYKWQFNIQKGFSTNQNAYEKNVVSKELRWHICIKVSTNLTSSTYDDFL